MTNTDPGLQEIPEKYEDVTAEWLEASLRSTGTISPETHVKGFELQPFGLDTARTSSVTRILLELDPPRSGPATLIGKFVSRIQGNRDLVREFDILRYEVDVYQNLSGRIPVSWPKLFYGARASDSDLAVLLLEDIRAAHITDEPEIRRLTIDELTLALSEIAKLHGSWWQSEQLEALSWLRSWDNAGGASIVESLGTCWEKLRDIVAPALSPAERDLLDAVTAQFPRALDSIAKMPFTLCHGDFHLQNLLWDRLGSPQRVWFVDWQILNKGPGVVDLAYFLGLGVEAEDASLVADELLPAYHAQLLQAGCSDYSMDELLLDMQPAMIRAIGWLMKIFADIDFARDDMNELLRRVFLQLVALADALGCARWLSAR